MTDLLLQALKEVFCGILRSSFQTKKQTRTWKLQFTSHKKEHTKNSNAIKPKKEWDIAKSRWYSLGFQPHMTVEQARARAKQLNSRLHLKQVEERRLSLEKQKTELDLKFMAAIPELYKQEFEHKYVFGRFDDLEWRRRFLLRWKAAQKMLVEIQLDPADWYDEMFRFYDYFYKYKFSFSYIRKLLQLANLWGYFLSRKMGQTYVRIPVPRGKERARLLVAYLQKRGREVCGSDPLR